jgi:hypothetical protein
VIDGCFVIDNEIKENKIANLWLVVPSLHFFESLSSGPGADHIGQIHSSLISAPIDKRSTPRQLVGFHVLSVLCLIVSGFSCAHFSERNLNQSRQCALWKVAHDLLTQ